MNKTNKIFTLVSLLALGVLILGGVSVYNEFEKSNYKEEQFKKINKLNNDLIKVSQVVSQQQKDIEYLDIKMADNSVEIGELKRILSELDDNYKSLFNLLFELQSQKITEQSQGAETTPPQLTEGVNKQTLPPSEVSAPPPEKISTPVEREQEVVKPNKEYAPVPNKVTASCPRPRQNLGKYIANINLRKNYSFVVKYDVENKSIVNVTYTRTLPASLKRAIEKYLSSFSLTQDKQGCRLPIKLLKG